ncbi:MAG TPA: glycoside hydrolase family 32 protein [Pyrinomonadaceae bacterium]|nr:glycoside hydrolase family 32 protein [Pyrinomonadaceae bacterium]
MKSLFVILFLALTVFAQYDEPHRPQFHFSPPTNWMNDPNGMVYYKGEYHLFYQYFPNGTVWGPMHWGHAISKDLVHWENLPIALYPDKLGLIFSGSAVVDKQNTSGFGTKNNPPLVAMFTYHLMEGEKAGRKDFQYQGIAYSTDNGRNWTKYDKNPVIPNTENLKDFRDTKLFWNEKLKNWSVVFAVGDHVRFYSSPNLKDWKMTGEFGKNDGTHGGVWECPDIFPMKFNGQTKWVLLVSINPGGTNGGSATQYFIGDFDGKTFKNDNPSNEILWVDYGRDDYAGVTWSNAPNNRRIFLGWMSNWDYAQKVPTEKWRSAMTLPRELALKQTEKGLRLVQNPVKETESLRAKQFLGPQKFELNKELNIGDGKSSLVEINLEIDLSQTQAKEFGIELSNSKDETYRIGYNLDTKRFISDRTNSGKKDFSDIFAKNKHFASRLSNNNRLKLHLFFDKASAEMFADDGEVVMTDIFFPTEDFIKFKLYGDGKVFFTQAKAWNLKSIWH